MECAYGSLHNVVYSSAVSITKEISYLAHLRMSILMVSLIGLCQSNVEIRIKKTGLASAL